MRIDRALFQVLVSSLSIASCYAEQPPHVVPSAEPRPLRTGDCAELDPGGHCDAPAFVRAECARWNLYFKPAVAERALVCGLELSAEEVCDEDRVWSCTRKALEGAAPDPAVATGCDAIRRTCPGLGASQCVAGMSALSESGRQRMAACLVADDCGGDFWPCMESWGIGDL